MWVVMLPELYPTCNPWFPEPANVVVTLGLAIWVTVLGDGLPAGIRRREKNGPFTIRLLLLQLGANQ
jgi:hypothetical protein